MRKTRRPTPRLRWVWRSFQPTAHDLEQQQQREEAVQKQCHRNQEDRERGAAQHRALRIAQAYRAAGKERAEPARDLGGGEQDPDRRANEPHFTEERGTQLD